VAIKSALNPGAIVNERPASLSAATNFITGGAPLGQSILSSAANKIIGFERPGSAAVAPRVPDLGSIINTLSSSILNNVENRLQSVNQNVVNIVNNKLQTLESDYAGRLSKVETDKPNNILKNFLSLYRDAIGFIQFLGNKKNIKTLGNNLDALRKVFEESFNIAKIIRQTIIKIVDQLSNLPTADTAGGGGLNLDIKIPGSNVIKQTAPKGLTKNIGKFGKAALIGGAAGGAGALGSQVVNGMMDVGSVNAAPTGDQYGGLSGPILDKFNGILDRFSAAIANFANGQKEQSGSQKSSTSASPGEPPSTEPAGDLGLTGNAPVADISKDTEFISEVQKLSKEVGVAPSQLLSLYQAESGIRPNAKNKGGATGIFQLMYDPNNPKDTRYGKTRDEFASMSRADQVRIHRKYLENTGVKPGKMQGFENVVMANIAPAYLGKSPDTPLYKQGSAGYSGNSNIDLKYGNGDGVITAKEYANFISKTGGSKKWEQYNTGATAPKVSAAPTKSTNAQQVSQQVAQTPGSNQPSKPLMVSLDLSSKEQVQQNKPDTVTQRPIMNPKGTNIPYLDSSNDNNHFTLSSRLHYGLNL
jgi:hypothetical protein